MGILQETFTLDNETEIPKIGFGTWQIPDGNSTYDSVTVALEAGYRHIDTAYAYGNEVSVGKAVRDSGLERGDIFITTKLSAEIKSYEEALATFAKTMQNLDLEYVDLYLIHAPWPWTEMGADYHKENSEVWKAFEEIYKSGRAKAIGVSNFEVSDLESLLETADIKPSVNQIKYFIGNTQDNIVAFCKQHTILVEGFSPLATGAILDNEEVGEIAKKYNKTIAQLSIRYVLQNGILPLPKSTNPDRIKQNADVDFDITGDDMSYLDGLKNLVETVDPKLD